MTYNKIHFVGIGGIGMSGIARILKRRGYEVTGSDTKENSIIKEMKAEGIRCRIGHDSGNLEGCDLVVYSSSIPGDNAELESARKTGIPVIHRADMLSKLAEPKKSIAVTGAHGKTTTTAFIALIFEAAGLKPSAAIGGEVLNFHSNILSGDGDHFIFEADESDGSFLKFYPDKAVLLNIDREHLDYFKSIENAVDIYERFTDNIKKGGMLYYNTDDALLAGSCAKYPGNKSGFGTAKNARVQAAGIRQSGLDMMFKCSIDGKAMPGDIKFTTPGSHNVTNALAAISVAHDAGIDFHVIKAALAAYKGTKRRFEIKKTKGGMMVIEDYAHHPAEIEAVLRACLPLKKNVIVVFQPHRYTRTKDLFKDYIGCFRAAGHTILADIYSASEKAIPDISSKNLYLEMKRSGIKNVEYMKKEEISPHIRKIAGSGDMVLVLGAGDINEVAEELKSKI
ncbi:MAG: UDP-N-acetylmuramate--L-alanine ligase [Candidatus Omnitrophica bacterium]|nr:UDP-N-acetylmuramate--L-alanine ligase [Candidatus Omnitrophota bacterium]